MKIIVFSKIATLFHTVRYLKPIQVYQRFSNYVKKHIPENIDWDKSIVVHSFKLNFKESIQFQKFNKDYSFEFLNFKKDFLNKIDWNYLNYGRLWTYNLNYFEFLSQQKMTHKWGVVLIDDFIKQIPTCKIGLEPYPLSLRCINWIRFFIKYGSTPEYDSFLYKQLNLLTRKKEYHILGNHLLENSFAFLFGAYYFNDQKLYIEAKKILIPELQEQILSDGGHFELSPMYHSTILFRLLDCYNLISNNKLYEKELELVFRGKITLMIAWMNKMTFSNGSFPLMNDAAFKIAPTTKELNEYAIRLGFDVSKEIELKESGYRKFKNSKFELIADVGSVGPDYQPGHAHADTFNFELYINGRPLIVDTGTSTYEINQTRLYQRSTSAHNTVVVNNTNSSQVWSGHRVGKRAEVIIVKDLPNELVATHNGYKSMGVVHKRAFHNFESNFSIIDELNHEGIFYLHFAPSEEFIIENNIVVGKDFQIEFIGGSCIECIDTEYAPEFNKTVVNKSIRVTVTNKLETLFK